MLRNTCILHSVEKLIGEAEAAGDLVIERLRNRQGDFRARVGDVEQVDLLVIFTRRDFLSAQHPAKLAWRQEIIERSEEHTSELQSLMRISYAVFCLKKKNIKQYIYDTFLQHKTTQETQV